MYKTFEEAFFSKRNHYATIFRLVDNYGTIYFSLGYDCECEFMEILRIIMLSYDIVDDISLSVCQLPLCIYNNLGNIRHFQAFSRRLPFFEEFTKDAHGLTTPSILLHFCALGNYSTKNKERQDYEN